MTTTYGRFVEGDSPLHRLDPRVKLAALLVFVFSLFFAPRNTVLLLPLAVLPCLMALGSIPAARAARDLRALALLLLFTFVMRGFLMARQDVVWSWGPFAMSWESLSNAVRFSARLFLMVFAAGILSYVTTPKSLADGLEKALEPAGRLGLPVHELALMTNIALRLVPVMVDEANSLVDAQASRGLDLRRLTPVRKVRAAGALVIPLFVLTVRRASALANAMEARGYDGSGTATKLRPLRYGRADAVAWACMALYAVAFALLSWLAVSCGLF